MTELSDYVTPSMLAKQTGLSYHTILARVHAGKVPYTKLGNLIVIRREYADRVTHPLYNKGADN